MNNTIKILTSFIKILRFSSAIFNNRLTQHMGNKLKGKIISRASRKFMK